jgi:hypothetical protein
MDSLFQHGMWPLAFVIVMIVGFGIFRGPIAALVYRTKRIGTGSNAIDFADATERQQSIQAQSDATVGKEITQHHPMGPPSHTVAEIEGQIVAGLASFEHEPQETKTKRLIRALSLTELQRQFEVTYRVIFASQLELLLAANAGGGIDEASAAAILENAKSVYPSIHQSGTFEGWLSYLLRSSLIEKRDGRIYATQRGKEFMQYLVEAGLTNPKNNG